VLKLITMHAKKILHLSHTDIKYDSRILKEIDVGLNIGATVYGIGIQERFSDACITGKRKKLSIDSVPLMARRLEFAPNLVRHILSLFEFYIKAIVLANRIQPDLIQCNDNIVLPLGVFIKIFTGARALVYDAHELESNKNGQPRLNGKVVLLLEKLLWRYVNALIVVSPSIRDWYNTNVGKKLSLVVLNSPVFEKHQDVDVEYLRRKFLISPTTKLFIYIGNLVPGRGLELIVEALSAFDDRAALVLLGQGELVGTIKRISKYSKNIYFHERVPHDQVVRIAQSADFGLCLIENVSLSDYYCLPNKLFEYIFADIPVIASNFPDISSVVNHYRLGLCVDLNVASISDALNTIVDGGVSFRIDAHTLDEFTWEAQAVRLSALYMQLLKY
jgi:glycosyltransferase involved in cell wall biosynthesis